MLTLFFQTPNEWVSNETSRATAYGIMVDHLASGIQATSAWTRIPTSLIQTGLVLRAFRTNYTFGPTRWWGPYIVFLARAHCMVIWHSAHTVRSTRRRLARVFRPLWLNWEEIKKELAFFLFNFKCSYLGGENQESYFVAFCRPWLDRQCNPVNKNTMARD